MKCFRITDLKERPDFDLQIVAIELDTSASRLLYFSLKDCDNAVDVENFNDLFECIRNYEEKIVSINDNTELYELKENNTIIVVYEDLTDKFIIFDKENKRDVEQLLKKE